ncbi:hypothetical protein BT96DRAFT_997775 [Gymnopus androsaceus JB14]|uniref:mannosyl-oligosaccharide 1,2-alpha-mannosidase n=1 Tax=Gymnopus androsaceus JB14 TaxID=1447944 RepID=A0A6A4HC33_9AGAR|nr:hypothetical protein BT96DRAFT_997775 [Gymnopus androsaceus JB14]
MLIKTAIDLKQEFTGRETDMKPNSNRSGGMKTRILAAFTCWEDAIPEASGLGNTFPDPDFFSELVQITTDIINLPLAVVLSSSPTPSLPSPSGLRSHIVKTPWDNNWTFLFSLPLSRQLIPRTRFAYPALYRPLSSWTQRLHQITSPYNFTQVYSRWRSITHSSPELWTKLTIELPPALKTEADASKLEERITEWILRSSNLSIDLQVNGPFFRNRQDHPTGLQPLFWTSKWLTNLSFDQDANFDTFETTIHVLLSAYELTGHDKLYLDRAIKLANRVFDTESGLPLPNIKLALRKGVPDPDLPFLISTRGRNVLGRGRSASVYNDSQNQTENVYREMYDDAMNAVHGNLISKSPYSRMTYTLELIPERHGDGQLFMTFPYLILVTHTKTRSSRAAITGAAVLPVSIPPRQSEFMDHGKKDRKTGVKLLKANGTMERVSDNA